MKLKNKVAIITGAAGGLGRGLSITFAREGAKVVIADINETGLKVLETEIKELGAECLAVRCDVSSSASVDAMFAEVDNRFGTTHILINNAGLVPDRPVDVENRARHYALMTQPIPRQSLEITKNMSDEEWKRYWGVNVDGVFYCTRAALKRMEPQRYGKIINIASIAGLTSVSSHSPHYSAAKGAVIAFTRSVGYEVAGANIQVNAICPGGIETPAFKFYLENLSPEELNSTFQLFPLGRLGKPAEYAALAVHLASDESYFAGAIINDSGGSYI
jgi:3-oxoacyl-[acyl-carrier protein] reductase